MPHDPYTRPLQACMEETLLRTIFTFRNRATRRFGRELSPTIFRRRWGEVPATLTGFQKI